MPFTIQSTTAIYNAVTLHSTSKKKKTKLTISVVIDKNGLKRKPCPWKWLTGFRHNINSSRQHLVVTVYHKASPYLCKTWIVNSRVLTVLFLYHFKTDPNWNPLLVKYFILLPLEKGRGVLILTETFEEEILSFSRQWKMISFGLRPLDEPRLKQFQRQKNKKYPICEESKQSEISFRCHFAPMGSFFSNTRRVLIQPEHCTKSLVH